MWMPIEIAPPIVYHECLGWDGSYVSPMRKTHDGQSWEDLSSVDRDGDYSIFYPTHYYEYPAPPV